MFSLKHSHSNLSKTVPVNQNFDAESDHKLIITQLNIWIQVRAIHSSGVGRKNVEMQVLVS